MRSFSASMKGIRWATACFMTRADFTTCGRNILPAPKRSPTTFMPFISGPSMTDSGGLPAASRCAAFLGVGDDEVGDALTSACDRRSSTGIWRQVRSGPVSLALPPLTVCANSTSASPPRDCGSAPRPRPSRAARVEVVVDAEHAGVDDAHRQPGLDRVVEEDGVDRLAHRVVAAEGEETLETPPEICACGRLGFDPATGLDEVDRVVVVLLDAGGDGEDVGVEDDVFGGKPIPIQQVSVGALADFGLARLKVSAWPCSSKAMTITAAHRSGAPAAPGAGTASPSFIEIELTMPLPWMHFRPASITLPLGRVDHDRHAGDVGLGGDQVEEAIHRRGRSSIASSMLMSITWAPFSTCWRATASASSRRPSRISGRRPWSR